MKKTTLLIAFSFILGFSNLNAQDTISACVRGRSNSGVTMLTEYLNTDSVFITAWNANGTIRTPRTFQCLYSISSDTITFFNDVKCSQQDTGIYIFTWDTTFARDRYIITLVNDPCAGRVQWHNSFSKVYPCYVYENPEPLLNTCWAAFKKLSGEYIVKEFTPGNELYETEYDHNGIITTPRHQNGWYYNHFDTLIFVDPSGSTCGSDSGVYKFSYINDEKLIFQLIDDPCPSRVLKIMGAYDYLLCNAPTWDSFIGTNENILIRANYLIYPNPASNSITIENLRKEFDQDTKVVLYDLLGNKLLEETTGRVGKTFTLNVGHLSSGVYILQVVQDHEVQVTERIVIDH